MKFLRTASTRRLLAVLAGVFGVALAGAAIAIAATSGRGPVPPPKSLPKAIHAALVAPPVKGITARISFTNHLIDAADIEGTDPLLTGGSGRLWVSPGHGVRIELDGDNGDSEIVVNNGSLSAYDAATNTLYRGILPTETPGSGAHAQKGKDQGGVPTVAEIQSALEQLSGQVALSGAIPGDIGGRPVYTVRATPKDHGGLLGGAALAWDAARGVPLRFALYANGDSAPVLELVATHISYKTVSSSVFQPAKHDDARVVNIDLPAGGSGAQHSANDKTHPAPITGAKAVAPELSFKLDAPARAGQFKLTEVRLVGRGKQAGAMISYGQGLGGVYVIERPASGPQQSLAPSSENSGPDRRGLSLPTPTVGHHASAQELDTALGTLLQWTRAGVSYTVIGSVKPGSALAVARAL